MQQTPERPRYTHGQRACVEAIHEEAAAGLASCQCTAWKLNEPKKMPMRAPGRGVKASWGGPGSDLEIDKHRVLTNLLCSGLDLCRMQRCAEHEHLHHSCRVGSVQGVTQLKTVHFQSDLPGLHHHASTQLKSSDENPRQASNSASWVGVVKYSGKHSFTIESKFSFFNLTPACQQFH